MRRQVTEPNLRFATEEESIKTSFEPKFENKRNQKFQNSNLCVQVHAEVGVGYTKSFDLLDFFDLENKRIEQESLKLIAETLRDAAQKSSFSISDTILLLELFSTDYEWNILLEDRLDTVDLANCCNEFLVRHSPDGSSLAVSNDPVRSHNVF